MEVSNQIILWSMLVPPWLTLLLMNKEDVKRWMPVALFTIVANTLIVDSGVGLKVWEIHQNTYPLSQMISLNYGVLPVATMWIFKFTYSRFWLYAAVEVALGLVFIFLVQPWLHRRGIWVWINQDAISGFGAFMTTVGHFVSIYVYQMWQESIFAKCERANSFTSLNPAAAKPMQGKDEENK